MNLEDLSNNSSSNLSNQPQQAPTTQPQVFSIYQTIANLPQGIPAVTDVEPTINNIRIEHTLPNNSIQTLILLNQKGILNEESVYEITSDFNFPLFVENLQLLYGTLNFVTQQFAEQTYLPLNGGTINGNLTIRGLLNAYGITIDNIVGKTWSLNIGEADVPLVFSRTNIGIFEIPYAEDGNFYFKDGLNPINNFITINPTYKQIAITYGNVEIANSDQWTSSYTTVLNNSANWDSVYNSVTGISANFESVYTTLNSNSSYWIQSNANLESSTTGLSTINNFIVLTQATYNSLSVKNPSTLYFIVSGS